MAQEFVNSQKSGRRAPRILLAGGGTAGHVEPALNLADAIRLRYPEAHVVALGTDRGLETRLVPERGYELELIPAVPLPRKPSKDLVTLLPRMRGAMSQVRDVIDRHDIDVIVGFGGYVALPAYLAARGRIPFVVHEANATPGLANKVGARFTPWVVETVPGSLKGAVALGLPLRSSIASLDRNANRMAAREFFGLDPDAQCLFVFGGSQGARRLNAALLEAATRLQQSGITVLHAAGPKNEDQRAPELMEHPAFVTLDYVDRMDLAYAAADLAVCRAGAMTCAELSAVGLPAIYVPLPIGNGEQRKNALPIIDLGGGVLIDDADLEGTRLFDEVSRILASPADLELMSAAARNAGQPDASDRLVDIVMEAIDD